METRRLTLTLKAATSRYLTTAELFRLTIGKTEPNRDIYLDWALRAASTQIEQYCNLVFAKESLLDFFRFVRDNSGRIYDGGWSWHSINELGSDRPSQLVLSRVPVTDLWAITDNTSQTTTLLSSMSSGQTTMVCAIALVGTAPFNVVIDTGKNSEVVTVTGITSGVYNVIRSVNGNVVAHASGAAVTVSLDTSLYDLDGDAAIISRLPSTVFTGVYDGGPVSVFYSGGFVLPNDPANRTLPYDIEHATIRLLTYMYNASDRDPSLRSEGEPGIGNKQYWGASPGSQSNLPQDVEAILDNYVDAVHGR